LKNTEKEEFSLKQIFKPLGERITILIDKVVEKKTLGGIIIPLTEDDQPSEGIVIGIGSKVDIGVEIGDQVIFDKYAGNLLGDGTVRVIKQEDIFSVKIEEDL